MTTKYQSLTLSLPLPSFQTSDNWKKFKIGITKSQVGPVLYNSKNETGLKRLFGLNSSVVYKEDVAATSKRSH